MPSARLVSFLAAAAIGLPALAQPTTPTDPTRPVTAQPPREARPPIEEIPPIVWSIAPRAEFGFSGDLDEGDGSVTTNRFATTLSGFFTLNPRNRLSVGYTFNYLSYEFEDAAAFGGQADGPWEDIFGHELFATYLHSLSEQTTLFAGGSVGVWGEDGADLNTAQVYGVFAGFNYRLSPTLQVGFGVGARTQLEDDAIVLPLPAIEWQIAEQWKLSSRNRPGLALVYEPSRFWTIAVGAEYRTFTFRLDEDGPGPDGVGEETRVPIALDVSYSPDRRLTVDASLGWNVMRELELRDDDGLEIAETDVEGGPFVAVGLTLRF